MNKEDWTPINAVREVKHKLEDKLQNLGEDANKLVGDLFTRKSEDVSLELLSLQPRFYIS